MQYWQLLNHLLLSMPAIYWSYIDALKHWNTLKFGMERIQLELNTEIWCSSIWMIIFIYMFVVNKIWDMRVMSIATNKRLYLMGRFLPGLWTRESLAGHIYLKKLVWCWMSVAYNASLAGWTVTVSFLTINIILTSVAFAYYITKTIGGFAIWYWTFYFNTFIYLHFIIAQK